MTISPPERGTKGRRSPSIGTLFLVDFRCARKPGTSIASLAKRSPHHLGFGPPRHAHDFDKPQRVKS